MTDLTHPEYLQLINDKLFADHQYFFLHVLAGWDERSLPTLRRIAEAIGAVEVSNG